MRHLIIVWPVIAIVLFAISGSAFADTPGVDPVDSMTTAQFLARCQSDREICVDGVLSGAGLSCWPAAQLSPDVLTDRVVAWLKDHPNWNGRAAYDGIKAASEALWPCQ